VGNLKKSKRSPSCQAPFKKEKDMTSKEILEKVKEMLEINTRVNWDGQWMEKDPVTPNQEFQNVLDFIEKKEKERSL
jgi:tRNA U55 pseudouridine synthase TruB